MNLALFYDTETTGFHKPGLPPDHPDQPHIVQLAACLVDLDTRRTMGLMNVMIKPDGWIIPDDVASFHGITTELATEAGIPAKLALKMFLNLWGDSLRIGHNEQFDSNLLNIALLRHAGNDVAARWMDGYYECTQEMATEIMQIPPTAKMKAAGRNGFKKANLGESVLHFTGKPLVDAHNAMADVVGCMAVYFAIKDIAPK